MLLRSISKYVRDQNWFAVALDFFIVVAGILIAFQITNWNEGKALDSQGKDLLVELKHEIEDDVTIAKGLRGHFENVKEVAKRSITFMDSGVSCGDEC